MIAQTSKDRMRVTSRAITFSSGNEELSVDKPSTGKDSGGGLIRAQMTMID